MKKYQQLFKQIQETIQNETYAVGDFLPSEHDLMEQYQVSRDTVRKALSLLQEEGLIKKIRGQGSQVVKEETVNFPVSNLTSYQELVKELGLRSKTNVVSLDKIIIDKKSSLITGFPEFRMVWKWSASVWWMIWYPFWIRTIWIWNSSQISLAKLLSSLSILI